MTKPEKTAGQKFLRRFSATRITPIAAACTSLLFGAANAQQASQLDTVVVTGIRGGIESSMAAKKNSDAIVEVVTAEDIGKLPDVSIAESLARLPGLASQRVGGRAQVIAIRGMRLPSPATGAPGNWPSRTPTLSIHPAASSHPSSTPPSTSGCSCGTRSSC